MKFLILSKRVQLWLFLPDPPDLFIDDLQKMIFRFVWNRKRDRISKDTAIKNIADGGLGLLNILKLTWIRKLKNTNHEDLNFAHRRERMHRKVTPTRKRRKKKKMISRLC